MIRNRHFTAPAVALALALAAAAPASARFELNPQAANPHAAASRTASVCSEVCSANASSTGTAASAELGARLRHDPRSFQMRAAETARSAGVASSGPRSEVVSGDGYTNPLARATVIRGVSSPTGFDWGDAAIGAGAAMALVLLVVAALLGTTGVRNRGTRTAQPTV